MIEIIPAYVATNITCPLIAFVAWFFVCIIRYKDSIASSVKDALRSALFSLLYLNVLFITIGLTLWLTRFVMKALS